MTAAADLTFPLLDALVGRAVRRAGSRMAAYAAVGRDIGASESWVRKFLGRQAVRLDADTFIRIQAAYERECARWEAEAELQRARFFALREASDAMAEGTGERVGLEVGGRQDGSRQTASLVPALVREGAR